MFRGKIKPGLRILFLTLLVSTCLACKPEGGSYIYYRDLLVEETFASPTRRVELTEIYCPDATQVGLRLSSGDEISTLTRLGRRPRLFIEACGPEDDSDDGRIVGEIRIDVQGGGELGEPKTVSFEIPSSSSSKGDLALSELDGTNVRIRLRSFSKDDKPVYIKELYLENEEEQGPAERPRQVLLISVDTLREDAVGALGGHSGTPRLDDFLEKSETWTPHYAAGTWTKPSHAGLLTGQYPFVHGAYREKAAIRPSIKTLAERFREKGFLTTAIVYDIWLGPEFGFSRGFDEYHVAPYKIPKLARRVSNWIADHKEDSFFLFFHVFDVHSDFHKIPYEAPGVSARTLARELSVEDYGCRDGVCASRLLNELKTGSVPLLEREIEILKHSYDREVANVDSHLGELFENLERMGVFENMLVVFTSDHGESFVGPGRLMHGDHWEEIVRVPLAIKWPGNERAGEKRHFVTSALDIAPTLAEFYSLDTEELPGTDLRNAEASRVVFSGGYNTIVVAGKHKAVMRGGRDHLLYDLEEDPDETRDISILDRETLARLSDLAQARRRLDRQTLERLKSRDTSGLSQFKDLSEEEIKRLKSFGYLGN